jgi:PTH1 family peptidyl-tRNA hydrolase
MKIVVALGNPGEKFKNTRHNAAWLLLDYLLGDVHWRLSKRFNALIYEEGPIVFVKPLTFMNNSGYSAYKTLNYYGLLSKRLGGLINKREQDLTSTLLVIQDELDLNFGDVKVSTNSQSAGHRGVASIIEQLKTKNFTRLRLGIKNEDLKTKIPAEKFVLQNFSAKELDDLRIISQNNKQIIFI